MHSEFEWNLVNCKKKQIQQQPAKSVSKKRTSITFFLQMNKSPIYGECWFYEIEEKKRWFYEKEEKKRHGSSTDCKIDEKCADVNTLVFFFSTAVNTWHIYCDDILQNVVYII